MKKNYLLKAVLLLLLNFYALCLAAQNIPANAEIDESYYQRMNYIFSPLEKNRVPYGLMRDFAMEFTDLERYSGSVNDSNYVDYGGFFDIYQTLFTSRIHSNAGTWVNPIVADSLWFQQRTVNVITVGGLCYGYSFLRNDAQSSGLVTVNNDQVYDRYVNGNWQNPYQTGLTVAFAPATAAHSGRNISVVMPGINWFTNQQVSSIQFDAGDGNGFRNFTAGQPVTVYYPDSGMKAWNFKVTLTNSQELNSHSQIHIANSVNPNDDLDPSSNVSLRLVSGPQEVESEEEYNGKKAYGYITIRYANPDHQLRRPLIIAEGFDLGKILAPEEKFGLNNADAFLPENLPAGSVLRSLISTPSQYDVIYVDWKNGTDDIFRNAKLLKTVINLVNADKVAVNGVIQTNVIIGQSMGGLITRIALKEMENENPNNNHQTRLFISHDSPQQGVNAALAYQYMGRHFRNFYIRTGPLAAIVEVVQFLRGGISPFRALSIADEPASKQMLLNYISALGTNRTDYHDNFYQSLRNLGYPTQCRNVSLSNGSECANLQGFGPGASLLSLNGKIQTRFLGDLAFSGISLLGSWIFNSSFLFKLGIIPGRNEFLTEAYLNALADGGGNRVYYFDMRFRKKVLYFINVDLVITHKQNNAPNGLAPLDSYPGGYYNVPINLASSSFQNALYKYSITASNQRSFNFIPTTSSLDIGGGATTLSSSDYLRVYSASSPPNAPKQTPFANFITARDNGTSANEQHITFEARNADWAGNEIITSASGASSPIVDCSFLCSLNSISGPPTICNAQNSYTVNNLPTGTTVNWSASPANIVSINTSSNSATLTPTSNGQITLSATVTSSSSCGAVTISTPVAIGTSPTVTSINAAPQSIYCYNGSQTWYLQGVPSSAGAYNWHWYITNPPTGSIYIASPNSQGTYVTINGSCDVFVNYTDQCGNTSAAYFVTIYSDCYNGYGSRVASYPNPADKEMTVDYKTAESTGQATTSDAGTQNKTLNSFSVELYNDKGKVLKSGKSSNGKGVVLNTADIQNGNYFLHVNDGKEVTKKQVVIHH